MRPENSGESDLGLRNALHQWRITEPLPPRFGERVWVRITQGEAQGKGAIGRGLWRRVCRAMARPSLAASYVTVLLMAGLAAGYWHAKLDTAHLSQQLGDRYVQLMDPLK
jgi:hypothetical protein